MTEQQIRNFELGMTQLFKDHKTALDTILGWDSEREAIMLGLAECITVERSHQTHDGVIAALDSCIEGLEHAAMDYYVSTK